MILEGSVKSITFHSPQNGFTVLRLIDSSTKKVVVVTGTLPELSVGENLRFDGDWGRHPKFGEQFQAKHFEIVETFGDELRDILDYEPDRFRSKKIKGLSAAKVEQFLASWQENRHSRETLLFLYNHDITGSVAKKLWMKFGQDTISKIRENPYILCEEIWGIGFLKADEIAMKVGVPKDSPMRLQEAILYSLQEASLSDGHCYLPSNDLIGRTLKNLRIDVTDDDAIQNLLDQFKRICEAGRIKRHGEDCFFPPLDNAEQKIADIIKARLGENELPTYGFERELVDWEREHKFSFDPVQREAIRLATAHKICIITGGPGTGKTTILKGILHLARKMGENILLAAPTGRAAKRMGDCCGEKAYTIHRLLDVDPVTKKFNKNEFNKLDCNLLIVDEFSMVDTWLAASLLDAVPETARIVFVGDADQLPSVGPGNVLNDLLQCPRIPSVRLQHIFRQSGGNDIADKAARINQGITPSPIEGPNFHFVPFETPEEAKLHLQRLIASGVKSKIDIDLKSDLQILVPMRKGPLGIIELNPFLQNLLNPGVPRHKMVGIEWSVGDRVMQIKNNYDKNVFNGDVGIVYSIYKEKRKIAVFFDEKLITYQDDELDELQLAYACTIHKSQGSEYPAVIVILDSSHYVMLQRNLLYTAITRAKGHVWILSAPGAFHQTVRNNRSTRRYTRLKERLN